MNEPPCWCGRDHADDPLTTLGHAVLAAWRIPSAVDALDRLLQRWPWLYRRLGGDDPQA